MENFVLYHEIFKKDGMIMYKGRKKGTISYVAVSCIDKDQRIKVTNHVRIVYDLDHEHVVRFYEWYETSNHLWLVTDLCVGGSLQQMLIEDICFPESSVRMFGAHLIRGLQYLHERGIVFVNWHPSKIVLNGVGKLKFFDFSDSRKIDENYDELIQRFFTGLNIDPRRDIEDLFDYRRPCAYTAPEVLQGVVPGFSSDIWGLGCIFYEMFTGQAPFGGSSPDEIAQNILNSPVIIPKVQGSRLTGRASSDLSNLLECMLHKSPDARISLTSLWGHPFWQGALDDLTTRPRPVTAFIEQQDKSVRPKTATQPCSDDCDSSQASNTVDDVSFTLHLGSRAPSEGSTPQDEANRSKRNKFQLEPSDRIKVQHDLKETPTGNNGNMSPEHMLLIEIAASSRNDTGRAKIPIEDYSKMLKDGRLKYDVKLLPVAPFSAVKLRGLRKGERDKHLKQIETIIKTVEKSPPTQRRLHLINYLAQISMASEVSSHMVEAGIPGELCRQLKATSNQDLMVRLCQALAIIWYNYTGNGSNGSDSYGEILAIIGDVLRDQFRSSRLKAAAMAALGEGMVKMATDKNMKSTNDIPGCSVLITLINRCLHRTEEVTTNLIAARTIETVTNFTASPIAKLVSNSETMQQLYSSYKHATLDTLKTSAAVAMCHLTRLDSSLFLGLLDKTGSSGLLENLHVALLGVQEAVLEMFATVMISSCSTESTSMATITRRLGQDSTFLKSVMRLLEMPALLVRAKVLLLVLLLCKSDLSMLKSACDNRLVLYLERELKRSTVTGPQPDMDVPDTMEQCLQLFTKFLSDSAVPMVLQDCCSALKAVQGRKHPSTLQAKALRTSLPLLESVTNLACSPSLRQQILTDSFCALLGQLLEHARHVDNGQTTLVTTENPPAFLTHVLALVEAVCHCIDSIGPQVSQYILQPLAIFTGSTDNADIRIIGLKLCGDIIAAIVQSDLIENQLVNVTSLSNAVESCLLPKMHQFFADPDPSAVYLLRLLRNYIQIDTDHCILIMKQQGFPQLLLSLLVGHQQRITSATVLESLLIISEIAQINPDLLRDFILDVDLIPLLCDTVLEIGEVYHKDEMSLRTPKTSELIQIGMNCLFSLGKLVSDVVKRALQSKKNQEPGETTARLTSEAEELLGAGKPLTEMMDLLIFTLSNGESDPEIVESSIRLLNQIVSLYGGQQIHHGLNEVSLQLLCGAIVTSPVKQKRTLLRILKRLLSSGQLPSQTISAIVLDTVSRIGTSNNLETDSICTGLADEIKKYVDK